MYMYMYMYIYIMLNIFNKLNLMSPPNKTISCQFLYVI